MPKKTEPTFHYVSRKDDPILYQLEEDITRAIGKLLRRREYNYNEDRVQCAIPEVLYILLDTYDREGGAKAIAAFLKNVQRYAEVCKEMPEWMNQLKAECAAFSQTIHMFIGKRL